MITNWHLTAGTSKIKAWLLLLLSHGQTVGISNATQDKIILKKTFWSYTECKALSSG